MKDFISHYYLLKFLLVILHQKESMDHHPHPYTFNYYSVPSKQEKNNKIFPLILLLIYS